MENLTIELRLPKDVYKSTDHLDLDIVFRNTGKMDMKIPMIQDEQNLLFFDFLIVGDFGTQFITNNGLNWRDPSEKAVKMIPLKAGQVHTVTIKNALSFRGFDAGVHVNEQYKILAIYRDYSHAHSPTYKEYGKVDSAVWKGIATSAPVTIKRIVIDRDIK